MRGLIGVGPSDNFFLNLGLDVAEYCGQRQNFAIETRIAENLLVSIMETIRHICLTDSDG